MSDYEDVVPWLEEAVSDLRHGTFRPLSHYILIMDNAVEEIKRLRKIIEDEVRSIPK